MSWGEFEGDLGLGFMGSDFYTTLQTGFDLREGAFSLGIQVRLRIRAKDRGEDDGEGIRREDWDEPSDYGYLLRYVSYRKEFRSVSVGLTLGELSGYTLGNGSLIRDYASAIDVDHPHSGFAARVGGRIWQVDLLVDDAIYPELVASRLALRPIPRFQTLEVGVSGFLDFRAPAEVLLDELGQRRVDSHQSLEVRRGLLGAVGLDFGLRFGEVKRHELVLYADGNALVGEVTGDRVGLGLHVGARFSVRPFSKSVRLFGGLEYRRLGPGYVPAYVDLLYDVQRQQVGLTPRAQEALGPVHPTKAGALAAGLAPPGNAYYGFLGLHLGTVFQLSGHYDHRPSILGKALGARAQVVIGRHFLAALLVERFGVVTGEDLGRAGGLLVAAEARCRPLRRLYILAQYSRLFHLRNTGLYQPLDQLNVAVGYAYGY